MLLFVSGFTADVDLWSAKGPNADLLVKKEAVVGGAADILRSNNISYNVVIHDLQHAIDAENPKPEEIAQLQDRKGKCNT